MMSLKLTIVTLLAITISMISANERSGSKLITRAPCYSNKFNYKVPPERVGVKDRLCLGCSNYSSALHRGERLISANKRFVLSMQPDNNLVLYDLERAEEGKPDSAVWSSDTWEYPGNYSFFMEEDGFVKLSKKDDRNDTIWCNAKTSKLPAKDQPIYFVLGQNGEMALFQCERPYWASNTWRGKPPKTPKK
jgi:hypothetical protein